MRIAFMGTPEFAVPSAAACAEVGEVVLAVTQPDRPKGRGREVTPPPAKVWALRRGIPVRQPEQLKAARFHEELARFAPDVVVVAAYGRILPPEVLAVPRRGCVNVHGSLLPRYRGAAPIQWAVANGEVETGVSLMVMEEGLDTGPVFAQRAIPIGPEDTGGTMHDRLAALGAQMLREELPEYCAGRRIPIPQDHARATFAPRITREDGRLDFRMSARALECRVRAFDPWPGAFTFAGERRLKVLRAAVGEGRGTPGTVLAAADDFEVACGEGSLRLLRVQLESRDPVEGPVFLRGHPLPPGAVLGP
jgi:methionyl-tRNA formyltransferase